jgi:hypothetical protein
VAIDRVVRKWVVLWEQVPQERINCGAIGNIVVRGLVKVVKVNKVGPSPLCWNLVVLLANALISDWREWVPTPAGGRDSLCADSVFCILYYVFCILYFVFCILYSVFCVMYSVFCFLYVMYSVFCFMNSVLCILCYVLCILFSVLCILFSVFCTLYYVLCILCSVFCSLYSVFCFLSSGRLPLWGVEWSPPVGRDSPGGEWNDLLKRATTKHS